MRWPSLALALAAQVLPAQEPPVLLHLTVAGPASWRTCLAPTTVGGMLASQRAEAIWRQYSDAADGLLRASLDGDEAFARARRRLLDYAGGFHVLAWLEQAEDALHLPRWSAAWIATPDGTTDLAALAADCGTWLAHAARASRTRWHEPELSPPQLAPNGNAIAVLACAEDAEAAARRAAAFSCEPMEPHAVLRLDLHLAAMLGLVRDRPPDRGFWAALLGAALRRVRLQLGSEGPQVAMDLSATFGAGHRGLWGGLYPLRAGAPDLDWLVPPGTSTSFAWRVDVPALWKAWLEIVAAAREEDIGDVRERAKALHGGDVGRDVLAHLEDEALLIWNGGDEEAPARIANACIVVPVRDQPAFVAALGALPAHVWLARPRLDGEVFHGRLPWFTLAVGHGVACASFEPGRSRLVADVLDLAAEGRPPRAGTDPARTPRGAPPGFNARGRMDVATLVRRDLYGQMRWVLFALGGMQHLPRVIEVGRESRRWLPLLEHHGLLECRTLGGSTAKRWHLRVLW